MYVSDETKQSMRKLGLTDYEIKAYLALLMYGPFTAKELSIRTNLPYSRIYNVLNQLNMKGWTNKNEERPKKFIAKPPDEAVQTSRLRQENSLKNATLAVIQELKPLFKEPSIQERPNIWILKGRENIHSQMKETLYQTEEEAMIALPEVSYALIMKTLNRIRKKGVEIKIITVDTASQSIITKLFSVGSVRIKEKMFGGGIISDRQRVILLLGSDKNSEELAIWSDHLGVIDLAREYFNFLWKEAKKTDRRS